MYNIYLLTSNQYTLCLNESNLRFMGQVLENANDLVLIRSSIINYQSSIVVVVLWLCYGCVVVVLQRRRR